MTTIRRMWCGVVDLGNGSTAGDASHSAVQTTRILNSLGCEFNGLQRAMYRVSEAMRVAEHTYNYFA
jgi:hypothetical protein